MSSTNGSKLQIRLKIDVQLQSSNQIATSSEEFDEYAWRFKVGTLFQNMNDSPKRCGDDDCIEDDGMHGWCYSVESMTWQYCNAHAYILDYWRQYPELFEEVEL